MTPSTKAPAGSAKKKKLTRADMRKLVDQLIKFFKEHPEYELPALPKQTGDSSEEAA